MDTPTMIPGSTLAVGHVIDFFGEQHRVRAIEVEGGYLAEAGLTPVRRVAVDGAWRMTITDGPVPVLAVKAAA